MLPLLICVEIAQTEEIQVEGEGEIKMNKDDRLQQEEKHVATCNEWNNLPLYIYIYASLCVCMCACKSVGVYPYVFKDIYAGGC